MDKAFKLMTVSSVNPTRESELQSGNGRKSWRMEGDFGLLRDTHVSPKRKREENTKLSYHEKRKRRLLTKRIRGKKGEKVFAGESEKVGLRTLGKNRVEQRKRDGVLYNRKREEKGELKN